MAVSKRVDRLPRGRDLDLPVSAGEQVQCTGAGTLTLVLPEGPRRITTRDKWYTIRDGPTATGILKFSEGRVTRAPVPLIFSPVLHGMVKADVAAIRWRPLPDMGSVTFDLRPLGGTRALCCKSAYEGVAGTLESPELRESLRNHRDSRPAQELSLTMRDGQGNEYSVSFFVLPSAREAELQRRQTRWEATDTILGHLGRASTFSQFRLMDEAWQETEAALKESPDSLWLIQLAARAANRAQHIQRADELAQRLKDLERSP